MNDNKQQQQAGAASSYGTMHHGAGNLPGGNLFTPKSDGGRNTTKGSKSKKDNAKRKDFVYKAPDHPDHLKRGKKDGSRGSKFASKGNNKTAITADALGVAISQSEGACDGLRDTIAALKEDQQSDEALARVQACLSAVAAADARLEEEKAKLDEKEKEKIRAREEEETERLAKIPKGFSFSTRGPTYTLVFPIIYYLFLRWFVDNYFYRMFCDTMIVLIIFFFNFNRLHTYKFIEFLPEPARDGRSDHHKLRDFTRKCEYAKWSHTVDFHWENRIWDYAVRVYLELLCRNALFYYAIGLYDYVVFKVASDSAGLLVNLVVSNFTSLFPSDPITVPINDFFREHAGKLIVLKRPFEKLYSYLFMVFKFQLLAVVIYLQFDMKTPESMMWRSISLVAWYFFFSWYLYWAGLISLGKKVFRRVRKLHVSHGAYKQITVYKNIDRSEAPKVAFERIKNSVKSLCTVNYDSSEILRNIDVFGDTCDLALGFFMSHSQELEDFLLPQQ